MRLQDAKLGTWLLKGTISELKKVFDGKVLSYLIDTDEGFSTLRHRRFLKPLNFPISDENYDTTTVVQVPPNNVSNSGELIAADIPTGKS